MKEGYGGRAGNHENDEDILKGIHSEDVEKKIASRDKVSGPASLALRKQQLEEELAQHQWETDGGAVIYDTE